jgi:hypothetical protein
VDAAGSCFDRLRMTPENILGLSESSRSAAISSATPRSASGSGAMPVSPP